MELIQLKALNIGDSVYVVLNTGITGISEYQYIGVFNYLRSTESYHVFLSPYFLSTVTISLGQEHKSSRLKNIFIDEKDAIIRKKRLIIEERGLTDKD